jgi:TPR repeat protein
VARDPGAARPLLEAAARDGSGRASAMLASLELADPHGNREQAIGWVQQGVARGDPQALFQLARLYESGLLAPPGPGQAAELERQAAEMDDRDAQAAHAFRYLNGKQVAPNDFLARYWAERAIGNGNDDGYAVLARLLMRGNGGDQRAAIGMVRNLAGSGSAAALKLMGHAAMRGIGQPVDRVAGRAWYAKAQAVEGYKTPGEFGRSLIVRDFDEAGAFDMSLLAAQDGDVLYQVAVATQYRYGKGTPVDAAESLRWLREAVRQGDLNAINKLGDAYETGFGVPRDLKQAMVLYRQAAQRGGIAAFGSLASIHEKGVGTRADLTVAYTYMLLCQRFAGADRARSIIDARTLAMAAKLSAEEQAGARAAALAWQPGQPLPGELAVLAATGK